MSNAPLRVAEFFAGIGLVRLALEEEGFSVVFANDIEPVKRDLYITNFGDQHFVLDDVRNVRGDQIPDVDLATASFPCTDLSLAGMRAGLEGEQSGMFWEFARVLGEMGARRPRAVLLENVIGFASSRNGEDMRAVIARLNELGYVCDVFAMDARWFVPQSRPRLFIVGSLGNNVPSVAPSLSRLRPQWLVRFVEQHPNLNIHTRQLPEPPTNRKTLAGIVERLPVEDARWWSGERLQAFIGSLSPLQRERLEALSHSDRRVWATAYRRTRNGSPVWEIRADSISGCLRTARGGSSKQALVEAGEGDVRVRWMTAREYARLQGAPDFKVENKSDNAVLFGFGDGVCVPVIAWIARHYIRPLLLNSFDENLNTARVTPWQEQMFLQTSPQLALNW
jgi:DNA (cytosine-5)-methyltransferase 1